MCNIPIARRYPHELKIRLAAVNEFANDAESFSEISIRRASAILALFLYFKHTKNSDHQAILALPTTVSRQIRPNERLRNSSRSVPISNSRIYMKHLLHSRNPFPHIQEPSSVEQ